MRHAIWKKDDFFEVAGKRIEMDPSVVELSYETHLMWQFNHHDSAGAYGRVYDIRLEDGEITGELVVLDPTWNDDTMEDLDARLGGFYSDVVIENGRVKACTLKSVSIVVNPANPGARL